jgi:hypothetical protein
MQETEESEMAASEARNTLRSQYDRSYISLLLRVSFGLATLIVGVHLLIVYRQ